MIDSLVQRLILKFMVNAGIDATEKNFPHETVFLEADSLFHDVISLTSWKDEGSKVVFEFTHKNVEYRATISLLYLLALNADIK